jgi:hypothetical protein
MISYAKYNYNPRAAANANPQAVAVAGNDSNDTGPTQQYTPSTNSSQPPVPTNKMLLVLNSQDRDTVAFPDASYFSMPLPETFEVITAVTLTSIEIPFSAYNIINPRLYFSEQHNGIWYPYVASLSSGNYSISDFVEGLSASLTSARSLSSELASVQNTYTVSYSDNWSRIAISSDGTVPFTLQFRNNPVKVDSTAIQLNQTSTTSPVVSSNGLYIRVHLLDSQQNPFSEGAGCRFIAGNNFPITDVVVQTVYKDVNCVDLRIVPQLKELQFLPCNNEPGSVAGGTPNVVVSPSYRSLLSVYGTNTPGASINVSSAAQLIPYSANTDTQHNVSSIFGFANQADISTSTNGSVKIVGLQTPFSRPDGTIVITSQYPHFVNKGSIINISGTGTLFDGYQLVTLNLDDTHLQLKPDLQPFLDTMPPLQIYVDGNSSPPTLFDIIDTVELKQILPDGSAELTVYLKDKHTEYDFSLFAGKTVRFSVGVNNTNVGNVRSPEYAYALARVGTMTISPGSTYPDAMQMFFTYPTQTLNLINASFVTSANSQITVFDRNSSYIPSMIVGTNRFDFSIANRYVFIALSLDNKVIGNIISSNTAGRIFAKVALSAGRSAITYVPKTISEGSYILNQPLATTRTVTLTVYDLNGKLYQFQGTDFNITLEIQCKTPVQ